jgi:hypothetical protein
MAFLPASTNSKTTCYTIAAVLFSDAIIELLASNYSSLFFGDVSLDVKLAELKLS